MRRELKRKVLEGRELKAIQPQIVAQDLAPELEELAHHKLHVVKRHARHEVWWPRNEAEHGCIDLKVGLKRERKRKREVAMRRAVDEAQAWRRGQPAPLGQGQRRWTGEDT